MLELPERRDGPLAAVDRLPVLHDWLLEQADDPMATALAAWLGELGASLGRLERWTADWADEALGARQAAAALLEISRDLQLEWERELAAWPQLLEVDDPLSWILGEGMPYLGWLPPDVHLWRDWARSVEHPMARELAALLATPMAARAETCTVYGVATSWSDTAFGIEALDPDTWRVDRCGVEGAEARWHAGRAEVVAASQLLDEAMDRSFARHYGPAIQRMLEGPAVERPLRVMSQLSLDWEPTTPRRFEQLMQVCEQSEDRLRLIRALLGREPESHSAPVEVARILLRWMPQGEDIDVVYAYLNGLWQVGWDVGLPDARALAVDLGDDLGARLAEFTLARDQSSE